MSSDNKLYFCSNKRVLLFILVFLSLNPTISVFGSSAEDSYDHNPLPVGWEQRTSDSGESYYVHQPTRTSHWEDPRYPMVEGDPVIWEKDELSFYPEVKVQEYRLKKFRKFIYDYFEETLHKDLVLRSVPSKNKFVIQSLRVYVIDVLYVFLSRYAQVGSYRIGFFGLSYIVEFEFDQDVEWGEAQRSYLEEIYVRMANEFFGSYLEEKIASFSQKNKIYLSLINARKKHGVSPSCFHHHPSSIYPQLSFLVVEWEQLKNKVRTHLAKADATVKEAYALQEELVGFCNIHSQFF